MEDKPEYEELNDDTIINPNTYNENAPNRNRLESETDSINLKKPTDIFILEKIIEKFHFSKFHIAIFFVGIFAFTCDGYFQFHFRTSENIFKKKLGISPTEVKVLTVIQIVANILGALLSTNYKTKYWEASSNIYLAIVGLICIILMSLYTDPVVYGALIVSYSICNGFICNICGNFLIELYNIKIRGAFFLFIFSCRLFGMSLACLIFTILFNNNQLDQFFLLMIGLFVLQLGLCVSLLFILDSPRILFYNNNLTHFYEYIQEITTEGKHNIYNQHFKNQMIVKLEDARREIESKYGKLSNSGYFSNVCEMWVKPNLKITIRAIVFVILAVLYFTNIRDSHLKILQFYNWNMSEYIYYTDGKQDTPSVDDLDSGKRKFKIRYDLFFFYFLQFLICSVMSFLYYKFSQIKRFYFAVFSLSTAFITMILIITIQYAVFYLISIFEAFALFYYGLVYLHFNEMTTTRIRNYFTSILFSTMQIIYIVQYFVVPNISSANPIPTIIFNMLIFVSLIVMEVFWIDRKNEVRYKSLQEIEFEILGDDKAK
jgi:hypothetical protein